jgi:hypothetical protein
MPACSEGTRKGGDKGARRGDDVRKPPDFAQNFLFRSLKLLQRRPSGENFLSGRRRFRTPLLPRCSAS